MTDAHCHVSCGDLSVRELLVGRDFFGVHPWETLEGRVGGNPPCQDGDEIVRWLREKLAENPGAGVGEIGLDRLKCRDVPPLMREVFEAQLALALELDRPVVLHGAKCWGQVVAAVKMALSNCRFNPRLSAVGCRQSTTDSRQSDDDSRRPTTGVTFLFHGFSRSDGLIPDIVKLNGYISVGPAVLNDHAVNYRALVKKIPLDRLLVETDRTQPPTADHEPPVTLSAVLAKTAEIRGLPVGELERITDENAARFMRRGRPALG